MNISDILLGAAIIIAAPAVNRVGEAKAQQIHPDQVVVDSPFVHDPVLAYENGKYYLYSTGHGISQMTSADRKHWTLCRREC